MLLCYNVSRDWPAGWIEKRKDASSKVIFGRMGDGRHMSVPFTVLECKDSSGPLFPRYFETEDRDKDGNLRINGHWKLWIEQPMVDLVLYDVADARDQEYALHHFRYSSYVLQGFRAILDQATDGFDTVSYTHLRAHET